ncbi:fimbrial biogenesis chaperone [Henriciella aquimarina]|uniref:fimbrial biogenesis chaperone n=1 Tax=Henriciella aquimarina TaxID=545261 RepID=UPI000A074B14|nr:fimbria/pilus periplasmic chaperone [Henriciella aquimarina]
MFIRSLFILAFCLTASVSSRAWAYEFSPIIAQFSPTGSGAAKTFVVKNTHEEPIALQIEVYRRSADEMGNETREPEFDDFIVTPPQLVLAPGQSQSIRAQWIGDPNPDTELAYRLVVEQLPIPYKSEGEANGVAVDVKLGFRYEAALYVVPAQGGEPEARIDHGEIVKSDDGDTFLRLTVKNEGKRRAILQHPVVTVQAGGEILELSGEAIEPLNNRNIIAGTQAVVDVPVAETLAPGPVSASLKTDYFRN